MNKRKLIILGVTILIIIARLVGSLKIEKQIHIFLSQMIPEATSFQSTGEDLIIALGDPSKKTPLYYISTGTAHGYGGKLTVAIAVTPNGDLHKIYPMTIHESPAFYARVQKKDFLQRMKGKSITDPFLLNQDLDGVSGATVTCAALAQAIRRARRPIAENKLSLTVPADPKPKFNWGWPETFLVLFFGIGFLARWKKFPFRKGFRWISMLGGMVVLGFVFNIPLTMAYINKLLLGSWPLFQEHLYFYILLGGVVVVALVSGKNAYCEWFCPFGAAQEYIHVIGGGKIKVPSKIHHVLKLIQGGLALGIIIAAMITSHPAKGSYEVFGVFFRLTGSEFLFILLGIILIGSLMIKRPWCSYLCPLRPVSDYLREFHQWGKEIIYNKGQKSDGIIRKLSQKRTKTDKNRN